jgi:LmbE family N-acetylglucosaminyl deacetylase
MSLSRGDVVLHRLRTGIQPSARTVIVVAHPDDETLGLGGSLGLFLDATVVQVTTGAKAGQSSAMRRGEREAAFAAAGWTTPVIECHVPDQAVHEHLDELIDVLRVMLADADVVWTHPYEGGHHDHDSLAFLVQTVCDRLQQQQGHAPDRLEFASYHWNGTTRIAGAFDPPGDRSVVSVGLTGTRLAQKRAASAAYVSQAGIVRWFPADREVYRPAPRYDFHRAPAHGCLYERKRWPLTHQAWQAAIARAA